MAKYILRHWKPTDGYCQHNYAYGWTREFNTFSELRKDLVRSGNIYQSCYGCNGNILHVFSDDKIIFDGQDIYSCVNEHGNSFTLAQILRIHEENADHAGTI